MSSLNHPHIIAVHEGEASPPFPFPAASMIGASRAGELLGWVRPGWVGSARPPPPFQDLAPVPGDSAGKADARGLRFPRRGEIPAPEIALPVPSPPSQTGNPAPRVDFGIWKPRWGCRGKLRGRGCVWLWWALIPESLRSLWIRSEPEAGFNLSPGVLLIPSPGALENQTTACWESSWCCRAWLYGQGWALLPGGGLGLPKGNSSRSNQNQTQPKSAGGSGFAVLGLEPAVPLPFPGAGSAPAPGACEGSRALLSSKQKRAGWQLLRRVCEG